MGTGELVRSVKEQMRGVPDKGLGYGVLRWMQGEEVAEGGGERGEQGQRGPCWEIGFNYLGQVDGVMRREGTLRASGEEIGGGRRGCGEEQAGGEQYGSGEGSWWCGGSITEKTMRKRR